MSSSPVTLLLLESERALAALLREAFEQEGYQVIESAFAEQPPDVVVVDPGEAVLSELRRLRTLWAVPIVVYSRNRDQDGEALGLYEAWVEKPAPFIRLLSEVRRLRPCKK